MIDVQNMPREAGRPWLERLIFNDIVFSMSWEDPEIDREALEVTSDDVVLTITTAGCNALNLLCLGPRALICVDSNPAQNALLELKLAGIARLDHRSFFDIFGARDPGRIREVYGGTLRPLLSSGAGAFWDRRLHLIERNIYRCGRMGIFFRAMRAYLRSIDLDPKYVDPFFDLQSTAEQRDWYTRYIASKLWRARSERLLRNPLVMYLAGMHPRQLRFVKQSGDLLPYARARLEHALVELPIADNYFWSMAATGRFRRGHVPPYLREENFELLREHSERVSIVNGWLDGFLDSAAAASIDKFNLLDIFDWMNEAAQAETWRRLDRTGSSRARVLFRSGSPELRIPAAAGGAFSEQPGSAERFVARDRSATHGKVAVAVRPEASKETPSPMTAEGGL